MAKQKNVLLTAALVLLMAGCASTDKTRVQSGQNDATARTDSPESLVVQPITTPPTPAEIKDFGDRLKALRETLYSVSRNTYSLYLGGRYTATYQAGDGQLDLVSDTGVKTCSYSVQAELKDKADETACRQWLNDLNDDLTQLSK